MAEGFKVPETVFATTLKSVVASAKRFGLDTTDPKVHAFILHTAEIKAAMHAEASELYSIIHKQPGE